MRRSLALSMPLAVLLATACGPSTPPEPQFPAIDGQAVLDHIKVLASDEYEGRAPGTHGEELTVAYVADQFRSMGLQPGNTDGTFTQAVPLVGITADPDTSLTFQRGTRRLALAFKDDVIAFTKRAVEEVSIEHSDVVFVGYGVVAPEYGWDDYKGLDVRGKTLIVLVNDPPVPDPSDPSALDATMFGGTAMTYYGRWTYKHEIAGEKGAAAVFVVHETGPAGYPFTVLQGGVGENLDLVAPDNNMRRAGVEGWITDEKAKALCALAGQDFDALKASAISKDFTPVDLGVTASMKLENTLRTIDSQNVVAKLEGADPVLRDEYVVLTAHWDHLGIGDPVDGDNIYNGAYDNASGVGALLEIARAFSGIQPPPKRSILFMAVTAEEQGLLGSTYYAKTPIYPLEKTLANINMDGMNMFGPTEDVTVIGLGASSLDDYAREVAAEQGRVITPDQEPEKGFYYRADHFSFAKEGVPALSAASGTRYVGKPAAYGITVRDEYVAKRYHTPADEVQPDWVTTGTVEEADFYLRVAYKVAQAERFPAWTAGNEFKAKRDAMLKE